MEHLYDLCSHQYGNHVIQKLIKVLSNKYAEVVAQQNNTLIYDDLSKNNIKKENHLGY